MRFDPTASGDATATLTISDGTTAGETTVALSGTGTNGDPGVDLETTLTTDSSSSSGVVPAAADDQLEFSVSGITGPLRVDAQVGGVAIPVSVLTSGSNRSAVVRTSGVPEGWRVLTIRVTDLRTDQTHTWRRRLLFDRTAPTTKRIGAQVIPRGTSKLRVLDPLSGPRGRRKYKIRRLPLGRSRVIVTTRDRAGNTARRKTVVWRRISLSLPANNADLRLPSRAHHRFTPTQDVLSRVFNYDATPGAGYNTEPESPIIIRDVEWRLKELGYLPRTHRLNGRLTIPVIRAIQAYQRHNNIPAIGTIGPRTSQQLDTDLNRITPGRRKYN